MDNKAGIGAVLNRTAVHLIIISLMGMAIYARTLNSPFVLDDIPLIVDNPLIKDLRYFADPALGAEHADYGLFLRRIVGFASLGLSYEMHGLDVRGYHILSIALHMANAMLVYALVIALFGTPILSGSAVATQRRGIALFAALAFVAHPLQTEAVAYIYQRITLLAAFFYLACTTAYMKFRLATKDSRSGLAFLGLAFICAALAVRTKEIGLTYPAALLALELLFFTRPRGIAKKLLLAALLLAPMLLYPLAMHKSGMSLTGVLLGGQSVRQEAAGRSTFDDDYTSITSGQRAEYFITQFAVRSTYLRMMALPSGQSFLHDIPMRHSLFEGPVAAGILVHLLLISAAVAAYMRSVRGGDPALRLVPLGAIWFLASLSVESTVVPTPLLMTEYRTYLPGVGVYIAAAGLTAYALRTRKTALMATGAALVLLLFSLSMARAGVWKDEVTLWGDVVSKYPSNVRAHNNLGLAYERLGRPELAMGHYEAAARLAPGIPGALINIGNIHFSGGKYGRALEYYQRAFSVRPDNADVLVSMGIAYRKLGQPELALESYERALAINPNMPLALYSRGNILMQMGRPEEAAGSYLEALSINPDLADAHRNLSVAYTMLGQTEKAALHRAEAERRTLR